MFKCKVCGYECDTYLDFDEHKKRIHGFVQQEPNQNEDRSFKGDTNTPDPLVHPIPTSEHSNTKRALVVRAAREPQDKFFQIGIRCKRGNQIKPLMYPLKPLQSLLPTFPPTRPALRNTLYQTTGAIIENHATSREKGRHHEVRFSNLGAQTNMEGLPSVD